MIKYYNVKYDNIKNKVCIETFNELFDLSCDYIINDLKSRKGSGNSVESIINKTKELTNTNTNMDIFIDILECIGLIFKGKGLKGKDIEGIKEIKTMEKGKKHSNFEKYLKIKKMRYSLDDCILNEYAQTVAEKTTDIFDHFVANDQI